MAMGAIAVAMSSRASAEESRKIVSIVRPAVLVIDAEFSELAAGAIAAASPDPAVQPRSRVAAWKTQPADAATPGGAMPADPAFWVMTSGTTGTPKAVEHHHRNVGISARTTRTCSAAPGTIACSRPRGFTSPTRSAICSATLRLGATNVMLERWATATSGRGNGGASAADRRAQRARRSIIGCCKRVYRGRRRSARLRHYVSAGERLPPQHLGRLGGGERPADPRWARLLGGGVHDHRQSTDSLPAGLLRSCRARRRDSHRRRGRRCDLPSRTRRAARGPHAVGLSRLSSTPTMHATRPASPGRTLQARRLVCHRRRIHARRRRLLSSPRPQRRHAAGLRHMDFADRDRGCARRHRVDRRGCGGAGRGRQLGWPRSCSMSCRRRTSCRHQTRTGRRDHGRTGAACAGAAAHKLPRRFEAIADLPRTATGKVQRHKLRDRLRRDQA